MEPTERTMESVMRIHKMMKDLCEQLKRDAKVLTDPRVRAMYESSMRSIEASLRAMLDFEHKNIPELRRHEL